jgi:hypothetical protein
MLECTMKSDSLNYAGHGDGFGVGYNKDEYTALMCSNDNTSIGDYIPPREVAVSGAEYFTALGGYCGDAPPLVAERGWHPL